MRKTGLKQQKWGRIGSEKTKKKTEEQEKDCWIGNAGERKEEWKSSNKRKRGKWQEKLRKSSHWCHRDMKWKRRGGTNRGKRRKELIERREKIGGKIEDQVNDKLKLSKANEWENGLKQPKRKRIWKKREREKQICTRNLKNRKQYHWSGNVGDHRWGIKKKEKAARKGREGKKRGGQGSWGKRWKIILPIIISKTCGKTNRELNEARKEEMDKGLRNWNQAWFNKHQISIA